VGEVRPLNPAVHMKSVKSSWERIRTAAGVSCRLHDMRHTVATKMAEAGVPESTMLAIMGHMSRAMLERYSHIRMAVKREAVKSLSLPDLKESLANLIEVPKESPKVEQATSVM
jgi:integrase